MFHIFSGTARPLRVIFTKLISLADHLPIHSRGNARVFASGLNGPEGMAFDHAGNLLVTETGSGTIYLYAADGTRTTFASGLNGPASLVFGGAGNLYDAEFFGDVIYKFAPAGVRTTFASGLSGPANLAFDTAGNLFEADFHTGTIFKYTPGGNRTTLPRGRKSAWPGFRSERQFVCRRFPGRNDLALHPRRYANHLRDRTGWPARTRLDQTGNLFEADYNSGNVYKFASDGTRTTFATGLNNPANLLIEPPAPATSANNLLNLSTRAFVGTQTGVLIGGFICRERIRPLWCCARSGPRSFREAE